MRTTDGGSTWEPLGISCPATTGRPIAVSVPDLEHGWVACNATFGAGNATKAILRTGVWGETLEIQRDGWTGFRKVRSVAGMPVWQQFLNVRAGRIENPSPPEVGLRMAHLWDAIRASAARGGAVIRTGAEAAAPHILEATG